MQVSKSASSGRPIDTPSRVYDDTNSIYSRWTNVSVRSLENKTDHTAENEKWMRAVTDLEEDVQNETHQVEAHAPSSALPSNAQNHVQQRPLSTASSVITHSSSSLVSSIIPNEIAASPHLSVFSGRTLVNYQSTQPYLPDGPSPRGARAEVYYPRGVTSSTGSRETDDKWLPAIQSVLNYTFRNPSLLEEALESPGSGVTVVGSESRAIPDGNLGLASVGKKLLELILADQAYTLRLTKSMFSIPLSPPLSFDLEEVLKRSQRRWSLRPKRSFTG